jgi:CO/xanthine dehydrogenase FAD-binding subunit
MNLNTITEIKRPSSTDDIYGWREGYAWLAGGTWLFSTPQIGTDTLIDLESLRWPALQASGDGLEIAATCTIAELNRFKAPADWVAAPLMRLCCHSLLISFKICNAATVGGNICMSLPAGSMISLSVALEGLYTLWPRDAKPRNVAAIDFVTENHTNALRPGELLRSIHLPASALEALRLPPLFAHPSRAVGGAHDRHPGCAQRRSPCDRHGGDGQAHATSFRSRADRHQAASRHRCAYLRCRLLRRCARLGRL